MRIAIDFKILLLVFIFGLTIQAQNLSLTGKVIDSEGNPLSGVSVKLLKYDIQTTTSEEGIFVIDKAVLVGKTISLSKSLNISNNKLTVTSTSAKEITADLLNIQGKKIHSFSKVVQSGVYTFPLKDIVGNYISSGVYLLSISWEGDNLRQKITSLGNGNFTLSGFSASENSNKFSNRKRSETRQAMLDTIEVSLTGFFISKTGLEYLQGEISPITLYTLKDELTIAKAFNFSEKPIFKQKSGSSDSLIYVGDDFEIYETLKVGDQDYSISWSTSTTDNSNSAKLEIQGSNVNIERGPLSDNAKDYTVTAEALINGKNAKADFYFKVLSDPLVIMEWNIWGKNGDDYPYSYNGESIPQKKRVAMIIEKYNPDVIGMIESYGQMNYLKSQLPEHKYHYGGESSGDNISILSKYPITKELDLNAYYNFKGAEIDISEDRKISFFSSWLDWHESNWPRDADKVSDAQGVAFDIQYRLPEIKKLTTYIKNNGYSDDSDGRPLFIVGDHNSISHLDYTEETVGTDQNYGRGAIESPISMHVTDNGFVDSYRELYPSPIQDPGMTYDAFNVNFADPWISWKCHFRIDYIYYKSTMVVPVESMVVDKFLDGKSTNNAFPSDHAAVVTTFEWLD